MPLPLVGSGAPRLARRSVASTRLKRPAPSCSRGGRGVLGVNAPACRLGMLCRSLLAAVPIRTTTRQRAPGWLSTVPTGGHAATTFRNDSRPLPPPPRKYSARSTNASEPSCLSEERLDPLIEAHSSFPRSLPFGGRTKDPTDHGCPQRQRRAGSPRLPSPATAATATGTPGVPVMPVAVSAALGLGIHDPVFRRRPGGGNRSAHPPCSLGGVRVPPKTCGGAILSQPKLRPSMGRKAMRRVAALPTREELTPIPPRPLPLLGRGSGGRHAAPRPANGPPRRPPRWLPGPPFAIVIMHSCVHTSISAYPACEKWLRFGQNRCFDPVFRWCSTWCTLVQCPYRRPVRRGEKVARSG